MVAEFENHATGRALTSRPAQAALIRGAGGQRLTIEELLARAMALAGKLPTRAYVVNKCVSRSGFLTGLVAAMLRNQVTLMPPNRQPGTLAALQEDIGAFTLLTDQPGDELQTNFNCVSVTTDYAPAVAEVPVLDSEQLCIIAYTSGSTGESTPVEKPWYTLHEGARVNRDELLSGLSGRIELLATVPSQHMYGFETAAMLPLAANIVLHDGQPFYPQDIADALHQMGAPRVLVSTPIHLRALLRSGIQLPPLKRIISATAPMDIELASACEETWNTELLDIYGCSEAGCIARRRLTGSESWQLFSAFELKKIGGAVMANATHLPAPVALPDQIEQLTFPHFRLLGRSEDIVNIAGKRASLAAINTMLLRIEGVEDGVVFQTDPEANRLSALVVAPTLSNSELRKQLIKTIDPVMLPRPIVFTDRLPRNATGKLPRQSLLNAWHSARGR